MKRNLRILRIIETFLHVVIVPLCIVNGFAYVSKYNTNGELFPANFLDAADWIDNYIPTCLLVILAILAIVFTWTRHCHFVWFPVIFEVVIVLRTIVYYIMKQSAGQEDHLGPLAGLFVILILAALTVAVMMNRLTEKAGSPQGDR